MEFYLEPEQVALFERLVEASRNVPRAQRQPFLRVRLAGGTIIQGNGISEQVLDEDVDVLEHEGLIRFRDDVFTIPPRALEFYRQLKSRAEPIDEVEQTVVKYLDSPEFGSRYPAAYGRWKDAAELLWQSDSDQELSTIGHKCREAIQEFVTALIDLHQVGDANPDKAMTRDRFSAVLAARRSQLGTAKHNMLDALFDYWRAVGDLVQRQEHAGQREGEQLVWEDGRRAVFQTAVVMFEADRTL